jgi:hypothetical protein
MKHRVKKHHWRKGELVITELWFDNFGDAYAEANAEAQYDSKVYDGDGQLVHVNLGSVTIENTHYEYATYA